MIKMIEIKNYSKTYNNDNVAVHDLSFTVDDGEILAFIGHNGAGKTTTLKSIVGILAFEAGEILINGKSIQKQPVECKKEIAYIPDNPEIYENMKAIDFINFICDMYDIDIKTRTENIQKYSAIFEMTEYLNDEISTFSHGMKQKINLIAALSHNPNILILDEPFVGLDPKAVFEVKKIMKQMSKEGKTIIFSTHILDVAEKLCTKVLFLQKGKLISIGSMKEIKGDKSLESAFLKLNGEK